MREQTVAIQAKDPICGMMVDKATALTAEHRGSMHYFCSANCLQKFKAAPEKYAGEPTGQKERGGDSGTEPPAAALTKVAHKDVLYTCPMHPEVVQNGPGNCPKCGMALEPRSGAAEQDDDAELRDMSRRFWGSAALAFPVFLSAMAAEFWPESMAAIVEPKLRQWIEMLLATPAVVWGGWPFYVRAVRSIITRHLNMFTLIGLGVAGV